MSCYNEKIKNIHPPPPPPPPPLKKKEKIKIWPIASVWSLVLFSNCNSYWSIVSVYWGVILCMGKGRPFMERCCETWLRHWDETCSWYSAGGKHIVGHMPRECCQCLKSFQCILALGWHGNCLLIGGSRPKIPKFLLFVRDSCNCPHIMFCPGSDVCVAAGPTLYGSQHQLYCMLASVYVSISLC